MTKLLLHIGGEKTGTTSLQAFLTRNARLLLDKYGILYPVSGPLFLDSGHFPAVSAFLAPERCDFIPASARLRRETVAETLLELARAKRPRMIILSAEHFSSRLDRGGVQDLADTLDQFRTEILFYVRRQDDLAVSGFSSAVRAGTRNWLDANRISPDARFFNYLAVADDWSDAFGRGSMAVRSFDALDGRIEPGFLSDIGIDDPGDFELVKAKNGKISLEEAAVTLLVNRHLPTWAEARQAKQEDAFFEAQRLRERIRLFVSDDLAEKTSLAAALGPEARAAIMSRFAAVNERLAQKYGVRISDEIRRTNAPPVPEPGIDPDAKLDLLAKVLVDMSREVVALERRAAAMQARTLRGRARAARDAVRRRVRSP